MPDRLMRFLGEVEIVNAVGSICMTIGLIVACLLLNSSLRELGELRRQTERRTEVVAAMLVSLQRQTELLDEAVKRLHPPLEVTPKR